jgi:hypothetical protein
MQEGHQLDLTAIALERLEAGAATAILDLNRLIV